jgi:hypothetical protein
MSVLPSSEEDTAELRLLQKSWLAVVLETRDPEEHDFRQREEE